MLPQTVTGGATAFNYLHFDLRTRFADEQSAKDIAASLNALVPEEEKMKLGLAISVADKDLLIAGDYDAVHNLPRFRGPSNRLPPPPNVTAPAGYEIVGDNTISPNTRELRISVDMDNKEVFPNKRLPSKGQLEEVWNHLSKQGITRRLVIRFYLPGMPVTGGTWGVVEPDSKGVPRAKTYRSQVPEEFARKRYPPPDD